jgi:hypothetical protein
MAMPVIIWSVLALILVALAVVAAARLGRGIAPPIVLPPGEAMPTAPLQRLARRALVAGLVVGAAAAGVVGWYGPETYQDDDPVRLAVTGLLLASLFVLAAPTFIGGGWAMRDDARLDERDRAVLARAPAGQAAAMLVLLAVWNIALHEVYRGAPGVPAAFLDLIMWSALLVSLAAANAGILLGYRQT